MNYEKLKESALYHIAEGPTKTALVYALLALAEAVRNSSRGETQ